MRQLVGRGHCRAGQFAVLDADAGEKAGLALAVAWLPLCLLLAGNLRLNFAPGLRSDAALWLSAAVVVGVALAGLVALGSHLTRGRGD